MKPSFARTALTPKWIGAFFVAVGVALIFGFLGQWQLDRAFEQGPIDHSSKPAVAIDELNPAGEPFRNEYADRKVTTNFTINPNAYFVVENRQQNGESGYWLMNLATANNANLLVAIGFSKTEPTQQTTTTNCAEGCFYEPSEDPKPNQKHFQSVSVEQAVNLTDALPNTYRGFVILPNPGNKNLETIDVGLTPKGDDLNLLNAFYALEWIIFSGFALFLWWRLVQDDVNRRKVN